jgi:hypothetical protein
MLSFDDAGDAQFDLGEVVNRNFRRTSAASKLPSPLAGEGLGVRGNGRDSARSSTLMHLTLRMPLLRMRRRCRGEGFPIGVEQGVDLLALDAGHEMFVFIYAVAGRQGPRSVIPNERLDIEKGLDVGSEFGQNGLQQ